MESIATLRDIPSQRLNKLVQIRRRQDLPMGDSELHSQFVEQCSRWCRIQPVGTAVYADGQQTGHAITHRIFMRRVMGITSAHEVVCGSNVYRVLRSADQDGGNRFTVLEVEQLQ